MEVGRTGGGNDWADEMEDEYYERDRPKQKIVLPTAPRAALGPDIDDEVEFIISPTISIRLNMRLIIAVCTCCLYIVF